MIVKNGIVEGIEYLPSPNFDNRPDESSIDLIVIHAMLVRIDLLKTLFDFANVLSHLLDLLHLLFYRLLLCRHYRVLLRLDIALSLRRLAVHKHRDGGLAHFLNTVTLHVGLVDRRR